MQILLWLLLPSYDARSLPYSSVRDGNTYVSSFRFMSFLFSASAWQVSEVGIVHKGSGYGSTLPAKLTINPPPPKVELYCGLE